MAAERIPLMAHLVAGFPDAAGCRAVAKGLVEGGAAYLEVQIPFSDPSADGPAIRDACSIALEKGADVERALALVAELRAAYPAVPVFIMAYASLVFTPGVAVFAAAASKAGASGLIVPDLPFDADEGLQAACAAQKPALCSVPIAAPSMRPERLAAMAKLGRPYLYAALRAGITGTATAVGPETKAFLAAASAGGSKVLGGFGIRDGAQARAVAPAVHAVVAGSVFVDAAAKAASASGPGRDERIAKAVRDAASAICAG